MAAPLSLNPGYTYDTLGYHTVNPKILTTIIFKDLAHSDNLTAININYVHSVMFRMPGFSKAALSTLVF